MKKKSTQNSECEHFNLKLKDYFLTKEVFSLKKNQEFGFLETHPRPDDLSRYYDTDAYLSHSDSAKGIFAKLYQFIKVINIRMKYSMLGNPQAESKLLDYGCGVGDFLLYAKNQGLNTYGFEPNSNARKIASRKVGETTILKNELRDISQKFDYITLWHVLEHIPDLLEFVEQLKHHLNPGGEILIAVPNHRSLDAKLYKEHWAAYDVPRHLWHFSPESIQKLFQGFGMKIEKTYPLWFDSFYVSLLSEKYKKNRFGFIRAFLVAFISNLFGIFNGNFSSVVYKIRKNEN